jgi:hypothetical protein
MAENCFRERSPYEGLLLLNQSASIMTDFARSLKQHSAILYNVVE